MSSTDANSTTSVTETENVTQNQENTSTGAQGTAGAVPTQTPPSMPAPLDAYSAVRMWVPSPDFETFKKKLGRILAFLNENEAKSDDAPTYVLLATGAVFIKDRATVILDSPYSYDIMPYSRVKERQFLSTDDKFAERCVKIESE